MRILTFLTFVIAITFMVGMDLFLFSEDILYGIGGIIGIIGFFIAYSISGDMVVAPRDYWRLSSWEGRFITFLLFVYITILNIKRLAVIFLRSIMSLSWCRAI